MLGLTNQPVGQRVSILSMTWLRRKDPLMKETRESANVATSEKVFGRSGIRGGSEPGHLPGISSRAKSPSITHHFGVSVYKRWIAVVVSTLTIAIAATPAFATTGRSSTSRVPSGTFQATVKEPASLKGVWRIEFHSGTDTDFLNGTKIASGTYTITGTTIAFAQAAAPSGSPTTCRSPGKYTFSLPGRTLKFTKISDPCNSVRSELLSNKFTRV
jgi:hypothetical protein